MSSLYETVLAVLRTAEVPVKVFGGYPRDQITNPTITRPSDIDIYVGERSNISKVTIALQKGGLLLRENSSVGAYAHKFTARFPTTAPGDEIQIDLVTDQLYKNVDPDFTVNILEQDIISNTLGVRKGNPVNVTIPLQVPRSKELK